MPTDSLDQHRRELDALYGVARGVREAFEAVVAREREEVAELAELRAELRALSNRVEGLTRLVSAHDALLTMTGDGGDVVSRSEVRRMIEEHGWSVKA